MKILLACLACMFLTTKGYGQADYYTKPYQPKITVYAGISEQSFKPDLPSYMTPRKMMSWPPTLQVGAAYNVRIHKSFFVSPELAIRGNNASVLIESILKDLYNTSISGYSTQLLLPVKYRVQINQSRSLGISGGLFVELPINMRRSTILSTHDTDSTMITLPITDAAIHKAGKGWQASIEYNQGPFQLRFYTSERRNFVYPTRMTGFTFGVSF